MPNKILEPTHTPLLFCINASSVNSTFDFYLKERYLKFSILHTKLDLCTPQSPI